MKGLPHVIARIGRVLPTGETLASVGQLAIKRARAELSKGYAAKTVTLSMTYLLAIIRTAYHAGRVPRDVTIGARPQRRRNPDEHKVPPDEIPTRAQVTAIWSAAPPRYRAAIALGVARLRVGEVLGMTAGLTAVWDSLRRLRAQPCAAAA